MENSDWQSAKDQVLFIDCSNDEETRETEVSNSQAIERLRLVIRHCGRRIQAIPGIRGASVAPGRNYRSFAKQDAGWNFILFSW